jgi:hypothetical protein
VPLKRGVSCGPHAGRGQAPPRQAVHPEALLRVEYVPEAHVVQATAPVGEALYVPTAHAAQAAEEPEASVAPNLPAAQAVHVAEEVAVGESL